MKKHIFWIIVVIILVTPTVTLGGSFVTSIIQGKTPSEAIIILSEQLDYLFGRVEKIESDQVKIVENVSNLDTEIEKLKLENENLKLKNENLERQSQIVLDNQSEQVCQSLFADIPKTYFTGYGENYDIKANIVRYYELNKFIVDNGIDDKSGLEKRSEVISLATDSYKKFKSECPDFQTNELPIEVGWCVYAEKFAKCRESGERKPIIDDKFQELNCLDLLQSNVPDRTAYICG